MLRYFYLISFFICINTAFLEARSNRNINSHKRARAARVKKCSVNYRHGLDPRYDYGYKSPVQQFDVAGFVQGADEARNDEEPYGFRTKKGSSSKNVDYDIGASNENNKDDKNKDYFNIGSDNMPEFKFNSPRLSDALNPKYLDMGGISLENADTEKPRHSKIRNIYNNYFVDQIQNHHPAKKSALKNLKFPFFSHKKSTLKPKRNKKRKLYPFNCPKKAIKFNEENLKKVADEPNITIKAKRLSDDAIGCSSCKKKQHHVEDGRQRKSSFIHNSRQFFQNIKNPNNLGHNANQSTNNAGTPVGKVRDKREEIDREKQLKELEEVEKKIDAVEIHMPTFEKKPAEPVQ